MTYQLRARFSDCRWTSIGGDYATQEEAARTARLLRVNEYTRYLRRECSDYPIVIEVVPGIQALAGQKNVTPRPNSPPDQAPDNAPSSDQPPIVTNSMVRRTSDTR